MRVVNLPKDRRRFGEYPGNDIDCLGNARGIPTAKAAYADGYECGLTWDRFAPHNNYVPGGPFVTYYKERMCRQEDHNWKLYCEATQENHAEWIRGWHEGRTQKEFKPPELNLDHIAILGYN